LEYDKAIDCYDRCFEKIDDSDHNLKTVVLSNKAQCYVKLKKYNKAYEFAD
jgi:tetratricopeptide (TPR) repeat protein